jgi:diaminohydroxyphosphoribosylaminopyrimidine deaminase / 5-amino-6-(5-phosphoribosylamino)uracil reductase
MNEAQRMLSLAARCAMRAVGDVEPNPLVGAVVVRDGEVLGLGHHRVLGGPHAEVEALNDCIQRGNDPRGATLYVTLEPCAHHGKQPPCTDAIEQAGIARVVYARQDPHDEAKGGALRLREAGVEVVLCEQCPEATRLSDPFVKRITTGLPWVIVKWAQTIDGRIATRTGESQWISGPASRRRVHRLRGRVDAILTGLGTVLSDDPMLTARSIRRVRRVARRVAADPGLDIPLDAALVCSAKDVPVVIACDEAILRSGLCDDKVAALAEAGVEVMGVPTLPLAGGLVGVDIEAILRELVTRFDATNVLVEAGAGLIGSILEKDLADELVVYIAPLLLGDELAKAVAAGRVVSSLSMGRTYKLRQLKRVGDDIELIYART